MRINDVTEYKVQAGLVILSVDAPPVNAISALVRKSLLEAFKKADADNLIKGIVLICKGKTFFPGADIAEFDQGLASPTLQDLQNYIENISKPVVSAIHGTALGGGLELALITHYRIAVPSAKFGFPEVKLGLTPGAGGTQRLPRLIGPEKAIELLTSGESLSADTALELGIVDQLAKEECLEEDAIKYLGDILVQGGELRRIRDIPCRINDTNESRIFIDMFLKKNRTRFRGYLAPEYIIQCVQAAASMPIDEGLKFERQCFEALKKSPQSKAQRYVFFAERKAGKISDIPKDTPVTEVKKVGVVGAGTMGIGIAISFLNSGLSVTLVDAKKNSLDSGIDKINKHYMGSVKKGRLSTEQAENCMVCLTGSTLLEEIAESDLVIEAVYEDMDIKKEVFDRLDKLVKPGAIMATNTSYLDVDQIALNTSRPQDVVGMHFFSPAHIMRLLEIIKGENTSKSTIATALSVAKRIGKTGVVVGTCPGFVGNRMLTKRQSQAEKMIVEGAMPWDVDRVLYDFGFPMGPFAMRDLAGLDIGWNPDKSSSSNIRDILNEMGRFGQKAFAGYYDYDADRKSTASNLVEDVILKFCNERGIQRRKLDDQEILNRCLYSMVNEGANILMEGVAARASDIDTVWVAGYGWPPYRGGPMYWVDNDIGISRFLAELRELQLRHGDDFKPSPLIEQLIVKDIGFCDV